MILGNSSSLSQTYSFITLFRYNYSSNFSKKITTVLQLAFLNCSLSHIGSGVRIYSHVTESKFTQTWRSNYVAMPDPSSVSGIATHFYKIAHLQLVVVTIYSAKDPSLDQHLLELELQIRDQHPRILLTYYNKCLYQFQLGHLPGGSDLLELNNQTHEHNKRLDEIYSQLTFKNEFSATVASFARPPKSLSSLGSNKKDSEPTDDQLAFVSLTFFKAVKKMIVFNLCQNQKNFMFGNYVASKAKEDEDWLTILQVDPVILDNGDLIVSFFRMNRLQLWFSNVVDLVNSSFNLTNTFVIYVIPSGLRCHLYYSSDYSQTFTHNPPKSSGNLIRLLKLSTGIDLSNKSDILWVKLIPNLQHLNNQTSNISQFIHEVDNKKFIMWPWELCLLQFGDEDMPQPPPEITKKTIDPLGLIGRFMDFNIAAKEEQSFSKVELLLPNLHTSMVHNLNSAHNGSSTISTVKSSGHPATAEDTSVRLEPPIFSLLEELGSQEMQQNGGAHPIGLDSSNESKLWKEADGLKVESPITNGKSSLDYKADDADCEEDDDLFGESSGSELGSTANVGNSIDSTEAEKFLSPLLAQGPPGNPNAENFTEQQNASEKGDFTTVSDLEIFQPESPSTFVNIPRDQMISGKDLFDSSYKDPGAPLPIMPTPVIFSSSTFTPSAGAEIQSTKSSIGSIRDKGLRSEQKNEIRYGELEAGYVFTPIKFNPVIKSSIDTKYGKGGKFYVEQEDASELEPQPKRIRETSVSHGSPLQLSKKKGSNQADGDTEIRTNKANLFHSGVKGNGHSGEDANPQHALVKEKRIDFGELGTSKNDDDGDAGKVDDDNDDDDDNSKIIHNDGDNDDDDDDDDDDDIIDDDHNDVEDEDEEEESDEDEELGGDNLDTSPLRLNTFNQDPTLSALNSVADTSRVLPQAASTVGGSQSHGLSPFASGARVTRGESPSGPVGPIFANELHAQSLSPVPNPNDDLAITNTYSKDIDTSIPATTAGSPVTNPSNSMGESSNCLPLILRSINVLTIPPSFFLRKTSENWHTVTMLSEFDMDIVEESEDLDNERFGSLAVKSKDIDEYLKWINSNLIFDNGFIEGNRRVHSKIIRVSDSFNDDQCTETEPTDLMLKSFYDVFPFSVRMSLDEFRFGYTTDVSKKMEKTVHANSDNHLGFLEEVNGEKEDASPNFNSIYWDTIYDIPENKTNAELYVKLLRDAEQKWSSHETEDDPAIPIHEVKVKVLKPKSEIINFDFVGLRFWRYLDLKPINRERVFQILLLSPTSADSLDVDVFERGNLSFLSLLKNNYKNNHFGDIKKLSLLAPEDRQDLDEIVNGTILIEQAEADPNPTKYYKRLNKRLHSLAELIKLDLMNKNNRFDFDRPLLLLFVDFDDSVGSISQISKLCRNFRSALNYHQLSLVEVMSHVIPWRTVVKRVGFHKRLKYLSPIELTNLSMVLYNKCPDNKVRTSNKRIEGTTGLFTKLVKERPESLNFKVTNRWLYNDNGANMAEDLFLHVAYERSIDRRWVAASWSDPHGAVTRTKSWHCAYKRGDTTNARDIGQIINEIWDVSTSLLKFLSDDESRRASGTGGKRYLVLTRVNSILPDDELVYWKRLTSKYKEVSLIVLSANRLPKTTFGVQNANSTNKTTIGHSPVNSDQVTLGRSYNMRGLGEVDLTKAFPIPYASSPGSTDINTMASPINPSGLHVHSPNQFVNAPGNFFSPQDNSGQVQSGENNFIDELNLHLHDKELNLVGFIPQTSLPCTNSPTRVGMKTGYLIKEIEDKGGSSKFMVFEVSLLSCSSQWNLNFIMRVLLNQFKKLIHLNHIVGVCPLVSNKTKENPKTELRSMSPWHINAIGKTLDYLVHIRVEDDE